MTFGQFARLKRIEAGKSQQVCAEALGLKHRSSFHKLEDGEYAWTLGQVFSFAGLLGNPVGDLIAEYETKEIEMTKTQELQNYIDEIYGKEAYVIRYVPLEGFYADSRTEDGPPHSQFLGETAPHAHACMDTMGDFKKEQGTYGEI